jgi:hypothetical protein
MAVAFRDLAVVPGLVADVSGVDGISFRIEVLRKTA